MIYLLALQTDIFQFVEQIKRLLNTEVCNWQSLSVMVGPTKVMIYGETLQVNNYDKYNWTMFDPESKHRRHNEIFPNELEKAYLLGIEIVKNPWK